MGSDEVTSSEMTEQGGKNGTYVRNVNEMTL